MHLQSHIHQKCMNSCVHQHVKLFAFELPGNIGRQAIFMCAAVWVTMIFFQNAIFNQQIAWLLTFSGTSNANSITNHKCMIAIWNAHDTHSCEHTRK
jgi:hypothetical protein